MKDTSFYPDEARIARLATKSYKRTDDGNLEKAEITSSSAANPSPSKERYPRANGGLFSTAEDYAKFAQMILNGGESGGKRYLKAETVETNDPRPKRQSRHRLHFRQRLGARQERRPRAAGALTAALSPGSFGHGGLFGTQAWIDPVKKRGSHLLFVQRAKISPTRAVPDASGHLAANSQNAATRSRSATMKLLLIGHGYLGQAVAREFRENGWDVAPVSLSGGDGSISCDVGDPESVRKLPSADFIVHCAASGRGGGGGLSSTMYVDGCRVLTEKFPGIPLLFTSSTSVYAQTDGSVVTEDSAAIPDRDTGRLLLEAEEITLAAGGTVARLSGIYGPGRKRDFEKISIRRGDHRGRRAATAFQLGTRFTATTRRARIFHLAGHPRHRSLQRERLHAAQPAQACSTKKLGEIFARPLPPSGARDLNRKRGWTHKPVS